MGPDLAARQWAGSRADRQLRRGKLRTTELPTDRQAFDFDGKKLHVRGEIVLDKEAAKISVALFTSGWHDVCIVTESETQVYGRMGPLQPNLKWTPRRTFPAQSACISSGTLFATESNAVINVDLGTMEKKTEQRLERPTAGDNLCPYGPNMVFVADSETQFAGMQS